MSGSILRLCTVFCGLLFVAQSVAAAGGGGYPSWPAMAGLPQQKGLNVGPFSPHTLPSTHNTALKFPELTAGAVVPPVSCCAAVEALLQLKELAPDAASLQSWQQGTDPCNWDHVSCEGHQVTAV